MNKCLVDIQLTYWVQQDVRGEHIEECRTNEAKRCGKMEGKIRMLCQRGDVERDLNRNSLWGEGNRENNTELYSVHDDIQC